MSNHQYRDSVFGGFHGSYRHQFDQKLQENTKTNRIGSQNIQTMDFQDQNCWETPEIRRKTMILDPKQPVDTKAGPRNAVEVSPAILEHVRSDGTALSSLP